MAWPVWAFHCYECQFIVRREDLCRSFSQPGVDCPVLVGITRNYQIPPLLLPSSSPPPTSIKSPVKSLPGWVCGKTRLTSTHFHICSNSLEFNIEQYSSKGESWIPIQSLLPCQSNFTNINQIYFIMIRVENCGKYSW